MPMSRPAHSRPAQSRPAQSRLAGVIATHPVAAQVLLLT